MILRGPDLPPSPVATVNEALARAAGHDRGLTFVDAREQDLTLPWKELYRRARKVAGALVERGIRPGDRVAMVLPTAPSFCDAFFGTLLAGAVPVPLYPPVRLGRMEEYHRTTGAMVATVGARLVVSDARIRLLLGQVVERARPELGLCTADQLLEAGAADVDRGVAAEALGLIQFSSGSTVDPKPVALSHRNLVAQLATLRALMPPTPDERGVSWLPLYHDMGLIGCLLSAAFYPGSLVLLPPEAFLARPAIWLRALSRFKGTISPAPNFAFALCLKRVPETELAGLDLSSWRYALNGAEPISPEVMRRFAERFGPYGFQAESLMPVYGLSEASLAVTFTPRRAPLRVEQVDAAALAARGEAVPGPRALPSVGVPVPGMEVAVADEEGGPLPAGRVGRILARGPSVMTGYFGNAEATARALSADGWLDTGDLGFVADGELYVCGRAKDLVIIRGANHAPQEFEECLDGVEGLRPGCAVALGFTPEGGDSEELLVLAECVVPATPALETAVRGAILERTQVRAHTVQLLAPGTLPRTSSGKLRRREALRRWQAGELAPPQTVTTARVLGEMARSAVAFAKAKLTSAS